MEAKEVDVAPKKVMRLGNANPDKKRPVKIILNSRDDKEKIMSELNKLKNAAQTLRQISVCNDYTLEERKLIQTTHSTTNYYGRLLPVIFVDPRIPDLIAIVYISHGLLNSCMSLEVRALLYNKLLLTALGSEI